MATLILTCVGSILGAVRLTSIIVSAEPVNDAPVSLYRAADADGADASSGRLLLRVPAAKPEGDVPTPSVPPAEQSEPPAEPALPEEENDEEEAPSGFFGEELSGNIVMVLDFSISMNAADVGASEDYDGNVVASASRLSCMKSEAVRMLNSLNDSDAIDFVIMRGFQSYSGRGGFFSDSLLNEGGEWKGALTPLSEIREEAIEFIKNYQVSDGTPTWPCLKAATHHYGFDIKKLVFLTDGAPQQPREGPWGEDRYHKDAIMADFPGWFAPLKEAGCELICIHIGQNSAAGTFMQDFAAANGAKYIHR